PQIIGATIRITMRVVERLSGRLDRLRRRPEWIFIGRQLDRSAGPIGPHLARQFFQRLSRLVGRDPGDLFTDEWFHSSYLGYDPSTFTASQALRSFSTAAPRSSMCPSTSRKNT